MTKQAVGIQERAEDLLTYTIDELRKLEEDCAKVGLSVIANKLQRLLNRQTDVVEKLWPKSKWLEK